MIVATTLNPEAGSGIRSVGGGLIRVLVWAKSAIVRAGLETIVRADERFTIARADRGPGDHSGDLLTLVRNTAPDVVLLDGSDAGTSRFTSEWPAEFDGPAFVVENPTRGELLRLLQNGQMSMLLRDSPPDEMTAGLYAASQGLVVLSPEILEILWPSGSEVAGFDELPPGEPLTPRETEVLALLADGAANKEIASRLRISEHTAKFHVSSILGKLGATTRTEAVARGYKEGLIII
jgi:DNA-binding NarL/FixJ family response regulator